jgi:hypothetical protein
MRTTKKKHRGIETGISCSIGTAVCSGYEPALQWVVSQFNAKLDQACASSPEITRGATAVAGNKAINGHFWLLQRGGRSYLSD